MTRFLLALLAMLTGLAASGQPVAARVCAQSAASALEACESTGSAQQAPAPSALAQAPPLAAKRDPDGRPSPGESKTIYIPVVWIGGDRALE